MAMRLADAFSRSTRFRVVPQIMANAATAMAVNSTGGSSKRCNLRDSTLCPVGDRGWPRCCSSLVNRDYPYVAIDVLRIYITDGLGISGDEFDHGRAVRQRARRLTAAGKNQFRPVRLDLRR